MTGAPTARAGISGRGMPARPRRRRRVPGGGERDRRRRPPPGGAPGPMRGHQSAAEVGELRVPATGDDQDRLVECTQAVPQRLLGARPGHAEARGEACRRVAPALVDPVGRVGHPAEQRVGHPPVDERGDRVLGRRAVPGIEAWARASSAARRSARSSGILDAGGARHQDEAADQVRTGQRQVQAEACAHRVAEVVAPPSGRTEERRRRATRSARTSEEPPCPGRSTRTSSWSTARSSASPPQTRRVWVNPWASTRRWPAP